MPATALQLRRGTTAQHSAFTGAIGEVTVDTTKKTLVVHDGSTAGGTPLAPESAMPAGAVLYLARNSAPTGFLKANGAAISRTTYAALFTAVGTTFGVGDGSTTFNLPDLRGQFPRGWDDSRGIDASRSFGSAQTDALQGHGHAVNVMANQAGASAFWFSNSGTVNVTSTTAVGATGFEAQTLVSDGARGTPRIAAETRPTNVALLAVIKF